MLHPPPIPRLAAVVPWFVLLLGLGGCVVEEEPTLPARPPAQQAIQPPEPLPPPPAAPAQPPASRVDLGGRTAVALLLPLSGPNAPIGRDMEDAAELALQELAGDDLALTPKDTHGTAEGAAAAAQAAVADGARLIVGPLTASEVEAVGPNARGAGIDVLAFSNQARVAGDGVFVLGFLPDQAARRIAVYAQSTGIQHFAVLAPATDYGALTTRAFQDAVTAAGGAVDQVQTYDPQSTDPRPAIQSLTGGGAPGFQALLLPEPGTQRLKDMASVLPVYKIAQPDVRLLGTDSWDVPNVGTEPALIGGWFAAPSPDARAGFVRRFAKAYGHAPQRLASLAYDAVGVAAVLQKTPGASFSTEALVNPSGFAGADGIFRLRADGTTERGLAVLQVEREGTSVMDPAPETFQSAGH